MGGQAAKVPNFFIIGAPKCGTTALAEYLSEHPRVFVSIPKEPYYWNSESPGLRRGSRVETLEAYLDLFRGASDAQVALGEGSTTYLASGVAVRDILAFNPEARFIAMVRNPVEAAYARHQQLQFNFHEDVKDFEEAWRLQEARREGRSIPPNCTAPLLLQYGAMASFGEQVERLLTTAPADRVKVFVFDDFARDPRRAYVESLEFLGLPDDGRREFPRVNEAKGHRYPGLSRVLAARSGPIASIIHGLKRYSDRHKDGLVAKVRQLLKVGRSRPKLRPEFEQELRDYFAPDVARLGDLLGRDLSHWTVGPAVKVGAGA